MKHKQESRFLGEISITSDDTTLTAETEELKSLLMKVKEETEKVGFSQSVQLLSHVQLFVTPWTTAWQASLSVTNSRSLLKLMSIESVMPSNHLILYRPLLPPSIFPSIRVFSNESVLLIRWPKYEMKKEKKNPIISSSVVIFSCLQSFPAPGSFPRSQFFASGGQVLKF